MIKCEACRQTEEARDRPIYLNKSDHGIISDSSLTCVIGKFHINSLVLLSPLYTLNSESSTLANNEDPDVLPH